MATAFDDNFSAWFPGKPTTLRPLIIARNIHMFIGIKVIEMISPELVLATVNAPYSEQLSAQQLVHCLLDREAAKAVPGHMSSFFGEVKPGLQSEFAALFNIAPAQLVAAAKSFSHYSGEPYPLAA